MKTKLIPLLFTAMLALHAFGQVQNTKPKRPNPMAPIKEMPGLPRVLLIGDSISIGYTLPTRALLNGKVNLHRIPTNGGPTIKGLEQIDTWLGKKKWDVIHFNWGLHDLKYMGPNGENLFPKEKGGKVQVPIQEYEKNLERLVVRMKKTNAKLIWRNTTPVPPGSKGRYVGDSIKYNAAAARVMIRHGIPTHDLFTMSKKRMKEIMLPANVHYTKDGSEVLGGDVAMVILEALK
ncbi:MAG: SGNH/GDSL hydrolase family protein [Verrucomicrobiota bacterium]|nr:SGNH/GDSL hydrolase family protein [Verrucomicrobiota bacterium]